jgi:Flp pilus assembly protein TadD
LKKAIEIRPLWPVPHNNLAGLYLVQGRKKEAVQNYRAAIKADPENPAAYLALGVLYEKDKEFQNAIKIYEQALKENPDFWFAANNLASLVSETSTDKEDLKRALRPAERALQLRPADPQILDTLGWVHYRLGEYEQARGLIEQALSVAPDGPIFNYHLGMVLYKSGKLEQARARLEKALDGDEDFYGREEARATLKQLG